MDASGDESRGLARGVVGSARVIAFGASNVAPAGAVVGGLVIVVSYAGFASPLVVLIAAEPVTDVDTTASDMLEDLDEALNAAGISLVFAELMDPVRDKIERYGLTRTIDPRHFFPTLESAVTAFRQETGAEWTAADHATDHLTGPGQTDAGTGPPRDIPASPPVN